MATWNRLGSRLELARAIKALAIPTVALRLVESPSAVAPRMPDAGGVLRHWNAKLPIIFGFR